MYILSMTVGYIGLRYIELSISSPVQNSSGAVTAILLFVFFTHTLSGLEITSVVIITGGLVCIAVLERMADKKERALRREQPEKKYITGLAAIAFPVLYCIIDGLGTFADGVYLDELQLISEDDALLAYEFTFFICALLCLAYIKLIKKAKFNMFRERDKVYAALFETAGQFFYVFAMADNAIVAAPLVASYSIFSVLLSRIFLKEKLTRLQYATVTVVLVGIAVLGLSEEL